MAKVKNTDASDGDSEKEPIKKTNGKILSHLPQEDRLPALLFIIIESIFTILAVKGSETVQIATIIGMVIVACSFFFKFFHSKSGIEKSVQIIVIVGIVIISGLFIYFKFNPNVKNPYSIEKIEEKDIIGRDKKSIVIDDNNKIAQVFNKEVTELFDRAKAMQDSKAYMEALDLYRKVITITYEHWKAHYNMGFCLKRLNKDCRAIEVFEALTCHLENLTISSSPSLTQLLSDTYNQIAIIYYNSNDCKSAYLYLRKATSINPQDTLIQINLLVVSAKNGKEEESKGLLAHLSKIYTPKEMHRFLLPEEINFLMKYTWFKVWYNT